MPESSYCQREVSYTQKPLRVESFPTQKLETQIHLHRQAFSKYFLLQSLDKARPSTTLHYKACTSQYYFVLQSLHIPSTTLYHKVCTKHVPLCPLLLTTKLSQSTSQDCFVLQSLHKARPRTICTIKLAHSTSQYYFVLQSLRMLCVSVMYCFVMYCIVM